MFVSTRRTVVQNRVNCLPNSRRAGRWCRLSNRLQCRAQVRLEELIEDVDVVVFSPASSGQAGQRQLGRVLQVDTVAGQVLLEPLVEEEDGVYVADDQAGTMTVKAASVLQTVEYELSQRQDKVSNPHGEHAHDVFIIQLPPFIKQ